MTIYDDDEVCVLTRIWSDNYFHFMTEILDKILIMESANYTGKYMLFLSSWAKEIVGLIGINPNRIIWIRKDEDEKILLIRRALVIEGFGVWLKKGIQTLNKYGQEMNKLYGNIQGYPEKIYLKRVGKRKLLNAEDLLIKYGFFTVVPEKISLEEEIKYFANAQTVVIPHGAAMANVIFLRDRMNVIEIFPRNWVNLASLPIIESKNINYHMLVESGLGNSSKNGQTEDYSIDVNLLKLTLNNIGDVV